MANPLPILRNTTGGLNAQLLYPFIRTVSCSTSVAQFHDTVEQRWVNRNPLVNFELSMNSLSDDDRAAYLAFMSTVMGRLAQDISITMGSTAYLNLTMMSDELVFTTNIPKYYNQSIKLRQVRNYPYTVPSVGSTYPNLKFGTGSVSSFSCEMPMGQNNYFRTDIGDAPAGQRYAYGWFGTGLPGFPSSYLRTWKLTYPLLTDEDAATLENFFLGCQGRYSVFNFLDPVDGVTENNVRFGSDDLSFQYLTKGLQSTELTLIQVH